MDFFTHFLVPFILLFALKSKNKLEGAFGGIVPDLDTIFVTWIGFLAPSLFVFSHRGITHTFIFAAAASTLFLYIISRKQINEFIGRVIRRDISVEFTFKTIGIAYFGALIHLFLDFLTSKGIPLFYPFTLQRFSAEIYYSIDITTAVIALIVMGILYLRLNMKPSKNQSQQKCNFCGVRTYSSDSMQKSQTLRVWSAKRSFANFVSLPQNSLKKSMIFWGSKNQRFLRASNFEGFLGACENFQFSRLKIFDFQTPKIKAGENLKIFVPSKSKILTDFRAYKRAAMVIFMIILISFGGIRTYEKANALNENPVSGNFVYSAAYPTTDMFTWIIVESDNTNSTYYAVKYNTLNKQKSDIKTVQNLTVTGGSVQSALKAVGTADNLPEVQNFRWDAYYTCINASYNDGIWNLTYFDVVDRGYHNNNVNVFIRGNNYSY